MSASVEHWDRIYVGGDTGRSWYQAEAELSLELIEEFAPQRSATIVDVGGGASTLVDGLVASGYTAITMVDISVEGLAIAQARLGTDADAVRWLVVDATVWNPDATYDVWHDRAVMHFMTSDAALHAYSESLRAATASGSVVLLGVFGPDGPTSCSGLAVRRWSSAEMADFLAPEFTVERSLLHAHVTPSGAEQQFLWTVARRA